MSDEQNTGGEELQKTNENENKVKENKSQEMGQKAAELTRKAVTKKGSLMAPLAHIIMAALPIIILVIIIIGIILFFLTMPGMVMENLKALLKNIGNTLAAFFGADTTEMIDETEIYETLDYLEEMGYDLKSFGFLTDYMTEDMMVGKTKSELERDGVYLNDDETVDDLKVEDGVIRGSDGTIRKAASDFIFTYIMSDNYIYTLKNDNLAIKSANPNDSTNWFVKFFQSLAAGVMKVYNAVYGPIFDLLGVTDAAVDAWGKGLILIAKDNGVGVMDHVLNTGSFWEGTKVKIDANSKTMTIQRNEFLNNNRPLEFSLDGWTGRYGMPIEFLLSIHISTMMPDLAYDMATTFNTNVHLYLHDISGEATTAYKGEEGYVTFEKINIALTGMAGRNFFSDIFSSIDNAFLGLDEADKAVELGIVPPNHPDSCGCVVGTKNTYTDASGVVHTVYEEIEEPAEGEETDTSTIKYYYQVTSTDPSSADGYDRIYIDATLIETTGGISSICDNCKNYIKKVINLLHDNNDYDFKAYAPYIAKVTNHWYRDVYFVQDDTVNFVDYDYDYEALMGERWTLYETYEDDGPNKGEFKLYKVNEDGSTGDVYNGTLDEAREEGVAVIKKAKTVDESAYEDLGWSDSTGSWTAYEANDDESSTGYERLFEDEDIPADDDTITKAVKQKLYINLATTGNIVQTGEGLRTETNDDIKKMFLQNMYFKYNETSAEAITELRKQHNIKYGALSESDLEKEVTIDGTTYKASDFAEKVSLQQDSLQAFSMLENTHTLDSDYIYRDFKELIVELGYFEKEELTDETPRLLQFLVPQIGSGGYPNRSIDKNENEFGTMLHSKGDNDADQKIMLKAMTKIAEDAGEPQSPPSADETAGEMAAVVVPRERLFVDGSENIIGQVAALTNTPIANLRTIGAITEVPGADYTYTPTGSSSKHTKIGDLEFNGVNYECWWQTDVTCTLYSFAFVASAYTETTFEEYVKEQEPYWCSAGFRWTAFDELEGVLYGYNSPIPSVDEQGTLISEALNEGKPVYFYSGFKSSAGYHAIVLLGASDSGKVLYYNPWGGVVEEYGSASSFSANLSTLLSSGVNQHGGHLYKFYIPDEAPDGVKKNGGANNYEGYKGNEAVVSPVTGILLDYGTYDDDDINSITGEKYRQNIDLKYPKTIRDGITIDADGNIVQPEETEETPATGEEQKASPDYDPEQPDKVGYAKILVLDAENYKKLESLTTGHPWTGSNSLLGTNTVLDDEGNTRVRPVFKDSEGSMELDTKDKLADKDGDESNGQDPWKEIEKTIYGYKEFAESYELGGIAGYVVYIDGFKCEFPDEEFTEEQLATEIPSGEEITLDTFKQVTASTLNTTDPLEDDVKVPSQYEKDQTHKMASKKATDKLLATAEVKNQANSTIYVNSGGEDLIFIKEGTVIGRTITDRELITDIRGQSEEDFKKARPSLVEDETAGAAGSGEEEEEQLDQIIGNYLRTIFTDTDKAVVENVEEYMKLDDSGRSSTDNDWELFYWLPFESGGTDVEGCGPESQGSCSDGETAVGIIQWTDLVSSGLNNIGEQFIPGCLEYDSSLCSPLSAYQSWSVNDFWNDWTGSKQLQNTLKQICQTDRDAFLGAQMEIAKKQYLDPLLESYPWLADRPSCVQGEVMHLKVWGADTSWVSGYQSSSDEDIIKKVRNVIANTGSTVGPASGDETTGRAFSEPEIGLGILDGRLSEDDVEQWVRTKDITYLTNNGVEYKGP